MKITIQRDRGWLVARCNELGGPFLCYAQTPELMIEALPQRAAEIVRTKVQTMIDRGQIEWPSGVVPLPSKKSRHD